MNKQILTDGKMQELFGANYKNILYYNFDAGQWNVKKYHGKVLLNQDIDATAANYMLSCLKKIKTFQGKEVVAVATMLVANKGRELGRVVSRPVASPDGSSVVGTVVCRDESTGQILPVSNKWVSGSNFLNHNNAVQFGAFMFCNAGIENKDLCRALALINKRQK